MFVTYMYLYPKSSDPFYIGAGKSGRQYDHLNEVKSYLNGNRTIKQMTLKHQIIADLLMSGRFPNIEIMYTEDRQEAFEKEKILINHYGRLNNDTGILTNLSSGGEKSSYGYKHTDKFKRKCSENSKGSNNNMFGKTHSAEAKNKISLNHQDVSGKNNPNSKIWIITDPDGNVYTIHGQLNKFAEDNNLSAWTLQNIAKKNYSPKYGKTKGWKCNYG